MEVKSRRDYEIFQTHGSRTEINVTELDKVRRGDHIAWCRDWGIWHHAIVDDANPELQTLLVVHYTKEKVARDLIVISEQTDSLYRFNYAESIETQNPMTEVLKRAFKRMGEKNYNPFINNCEHFATLCKLGTKICAQLWWALGKLKEAFFLSLGAAGRFVIAEGIEHFNSILGSNWVGASLFVGFELWQFYNCRSHLKEKRNEGKISEKDYKVQLYLRIFEGVLCTVPGAIGGAVVTSFLGSVIVGTLCYLIGKIIWMAANNVIANHLRK